MKLKPSTQQPGQSHQPPQNGQAQAAIPDPEVGLPGQHRRFSRAYKQRILEDIEQLYLPQ